MDDQPSQGRFTVNKLVALTLLILTFGTLIAFLMNRNSTEALQLAEMMRPAPTQVPAVSFAEFLNNVEEIGFPDELSHPPSSCIKSDRGIAVEKHHHWPTFNYKTPSGEDRQAFMHDLFLRNQCPEYLENYERGEHENE